MPTTAMIRHVLADDALTRGLGDEEARVLIEWLVDWLEGPNAPAGGDTSAWERLRHRLRRARAIARFVALWCHRRGFAGAAQLAASEGFDWPFPPADIEPVELMQQLVDWEGDGTPADRAGARDAA
jgi:hypothetical protein